MIITCPACTYTHELDSQLLGSAGRRIACPKCDEIWFVSPQNSSLVHVDSRTEAPEIVAEVRSERSRAATYDEIYASHRLFDVAEAAAPRRSSIPILFLAVIAVGALASSAIAARARIVSHLPLLSGAYAAIGLPVNLRGLEFRNVRTFVLHEGERSTLAVEGEITNIWTVDAAVPAVKVSIRDGESSELYHWSAPAPKPRLEVGETVMFRARLSAPPNAAHSVMVEFADTRVWPH